MDDENEEGAGRRAGGRRAALETNQYGWIWFGRSTRGGSPSGGRSIGLDGGSTDLVRRARRCTPTDDHVCIWPSACRPCHRPASLLFFLDRAHVSSRLQAGALRMAPGMTGNASSRTCRCKGYAGRAHAGQIRYGDPKRGGWGDGGLAGCRLSRKMSAWRGGYSGQAASSGAGGRGEAP